MSDPENFQKVAKQHLHRVPERLAPAALAKRSEVSVAWPGGPGHTHLLKKGRAAGGEASAEKPQERHQPLSEKFDTVGKVSPPVRIIEPTELD